MNWEHVVEIQQVVNGYFRALDERDLDATHLRRILTDDAKVIHIWPGARAMLTKPDSYFAAGGVIVAHLVRTGEGWRMSELSNRVLWRAGGGFERVMATTRR